MSWSITTGPDREPQHLIFEAERWDEGALRRYPHLDKVEILEIQSQRLTGIELLPEMPGLREMYLEGSQVASIESVSRFENLRVLDIIGNPVCDLSPLWKSRRLSVLWLDRSPADLAQLENLRHLRELSACACNIGPNFDLKSANKMRTLLVPGTRISDAFFDRELASMLDLDISDTGISRLEGRNLPSVRRLTASDTLIEDWSFLDECPRLWELNVSAKDERILQSWLRPGRIGSVS